MDTSQKPKRKQSLNLFYYLQSNNIEILLQIEEKTRIVVSLQETQLVEA